jgi:hypothetical protein
VETSQLFDAYREWMQDQRQRFERTLTLNIFGKELRKVFPDRWMRRRPGNVQAEEGPGRPGFLFGTLAIARAEFCARTGLTLDVFSEENLDDVL